jgi:hypothetical protein
MKNPSGISPRLQEIMERNPDSQPLKEPLVLFSDLPEIIGDQELLTRITAKLPRIGPYVRVRVLRSLLIAMEEIPR